MAKPLDKQLDRLERRINGMGKPHNGINKPGSMSKHKAAAAGQGRRPTSRIQADSRAATSS